MPNDTQNHVAATESSDIFMLHKISCKEHHKILFSFAFRFTEFIIAISHRQNAAARKLQARQ